MNKIKVTPEMLKDIVKQFPYFNEYLWIGVEHDGLYWHSDVNPIEIVGVKGNTIEIRRMKIGDNKTKMEFIPGGFSAHCLNNSSQDWEIESNPDSPVEKARIIKIFEYNRKQYDPDTKGYKDVKEYSIIRNGLTYRFSDKPCYYYDFNF